MHDCMLAVSTLPGRTVCLCASFSVALEPQVGMHAWYGMVWYGLVPCMQGLAWHGPGTPRAEAQNAKPEAARPTGQCLTGACMG